LGVGFDYKDKERSPNGVAKLKLKAGAGETAKVLVRGGGVNLDMPSLSELTLPLRVQLQRVGTNPGQCWEATFQSTDVIDQTPTAFKAKTQ
jgi:hypothetical protein